MRLMESLYAGGVTVTSRRESNSRLGTGIRGQELRSEGLGHVRDQTHVLSGLLKSVLEHFEHVVPVLYEPVMSKKSENDNAEDRVVAGDVREGRYRRSRYKSKDFPGTEGDNDLVSVLTEGRSTDNIKAPGDGSHRNRTHILPH